MLKEEGKTITTGFPTPGLEMRSYSGAERYFNELMHEWLDSAVVVAKMSRDIFWTPV